MKKENEITLMNAFLCLCVVMIHLTGIPLETVGDGGTRIALTVLSRALYFSVPSFIFLSGFKLYLSYGDRKLELRRFYMGRLKKIVLPYIICVIVYFLYFFSKGWASVSELPKHILLGTLVAHLYYVIVAVQLYLLFPLIKAAFVRFPKITTAMALICTVVFAKVLNFTYSDRFVGTYIFYFVLGMLFAKLRKSGNTARIYTFGAVGVIVTLIIHFRLLKMAFSGDMNFRYDTVLYVTFSAAVIYTAFLLISKRSKVLCSVSESVGAVSYNVYLYHILVFFVLKYDIFPRFELTPMKSFTVAGIIVYGLIFAYAFLKRTLKRRKL